MARRIDLMEDFVNVFSHEEMVAFFEIRATRAGGEGLHGLCRVSKPKTHSTISYLSLSFMIDTPDDAARAAADDSLEMLEGTGLTSVLPMVTSVMSMPVSRTTAENYVRQIDVMLEENVDPGRFFVQERLVPALHELANLEAGEIVWWGELAEEEPAPTATPEASPPAAGESLAARLKKYLGG